MLHGRRWFGEAGLGWALCLLLAGGCARQPSIELSAAETRFLQQHPVVTWAPDRAFAPVEWVDDAQQVKGLAPDYLELLGRKLGVRFQPALTHDWTEALAQVKSREVDMVSTITFLPERQGDFLFTAPYLDLPTMLLVRSDDRATRTLEDLGARPLALPRDYAVSRELLRRNHPNVRLVEVDDVADGLEKLALGQVGAALADLAQASWTIDQRHLSGIRVAGQVPDLPAKLGMGVRTDMPLLQSALDKALASLTDDERDALTRRWIGLQLVGWRVTPKGLAIVAAGVAALIALLVLFWNRALRRQVQERTSELAMAAEALQILTHTDALTGLRNRRYLETSMPDDVARVRRLHVDLRRRPERLHKNVDLLFAMVDLDGFKAVNDAHGHAAGDRVLQHVSAALRGATRDTDWVVRWGGEEFLVVGRNTDRSEIAGIVERLRKAVAAHPCDLGDGTLLDCTCSIGFALMPFLCAEPDFLSWEQVVHLADRCLYVAKRNGRDRAIGIVAADNATSADVGDRMDDLEMLARSPLARAFTSSGRVEDIDWSGTRT